MSEARFETSDWLDVYDDDDLARFAAEIQAADTITEARGIIHAWYESALVVKSGVLDKTLQSESEDIPLTHPDQIATAALRGDRG